MTTSPADCPDAAYHGNPFRYCPNKGCGWIEEAPKPPKADPDQFLNKAKALVVQVEHDGGLRVRPEDLFIVWFAKTLGNWKALVSTDVLTGVYWEVTYNGAKQETYVDTYHKRSNQAIPDAPVDCSLRGGVPVQG